MSIGPIAQRKKIDLTINVQRLSVHGWVAGSYVATAIASNGWGWAVHRLMGGGESIELVTGLDRDVALKVAQDMCAREQELFPNDEVIRLRDLQAILRNYLGGMVL